MMYRYGLGSLAIIRDIEDCASFQQGRVVLPRGSRSTQVVDDAMNGIGSTVHAVVSTGVVGEGNLKRRDYGSTKLKTFIAESRYLEQRHRRRPLNSCK